MALPNRQTFTVEEYFELEKHDPDTCYEYEDGSVYAMAGGSFNHDTIKSNIQRILWHLLRGKSCRVYSSDIKVAISETRYYHPDVTVTCSQQDRGKGDLLQSPRVVVEVLSPSTELKDRTRKLQQYLAYPTIQEYLIVTTYKLKMELYRKEQTKWVYYAFGEQDEVELVSLDVHFPIKEAYEDVNFEEEAMLAEESDDML
jgi:Uma2 family endonuclease